MLRSTFIHIPGIGDSKERMLWQNNIRKWDDFLENAGSIRLPSATVSYMADHLLRSKDEYLNRNHSFFSRNLDIKEHWRAYNDFPDCAYLDIETTGLSKERNNITVIGVYDGKSSRIFIDGKNMDEFPDEICRYSTLVTFNGRCFDLPFIKARFPGIAFDQFHIDLRFVFRRLGYSGGLKLIEKQMGIVRDEEIAQVDGFEAVRLWHKYKRGDEQALQKLIDYNIADIENLRPLADHAFKEMKKIIF